MRVLFLAFLFVSFVADAQQSITDSLERLLKTTMPDTSYALTIMQLARSYEAADTDKAIAAYKKAIDFAEKKKLDCELGRIYGSYADLLVTIAKYDEAVASIKNALSYLDKSNHKDALLRKAEVYGSYSNAERMMNDYQQAFEYRMKAIDIYEQLNISSSVVRGYLGLSSFFKEQRQFDKQELYAKKALEIVRSKNLKDDFFMAYAYVAFATIAKADYKKASVYIDSARQFYNSSYQYTFLVSFHLIAGLCYMNLGDLNAANTEFRQSYAVAEKNKASFSMIQSKLQLGRVLSLQKKFKESEEVLLSCYKQAQEGKEFAQLTIALDYLGRLYTEKGDYKKSLEYYKEYVNVTDSISGEKNKKYISELEVKYDSEKKKTEILRLESENNNQKFALHQKQVYNYLFGGSAVSLLFISFLGFRSYRAKQKLQQQRIAELEIEKQLAATEAVLKGEEQERTRLAKDLHDSLGGMLSGIKYSLTTMKGNLILTPENALAFERSLDMLDNSVREMRRVAHNMMPEVLLRYGLTAALQDYCSEINKSGINNIVFQQMGEENKKIDQSSGLAIYRIVQELINNAVKHAAATEVLVQLLWNNEKLIINVEDNGKGFDPSQLSSAAGIGWKNIQSRAEWLNAKLDIQSEPGKGTSVSLECKIV